MRKRNCCSRRRYNLIRGVFCIRIRAPKHFPRKREHQAICFVIILIHFLFNNWILMANKMAKAILYLFSQKIGKRSSGCWIFHRLKIIDWNPGGEKAAFSEDILNWCFSIAWQPSGYVLITFWSDYFRFISRTSGQV